MATVIDIIKGISQAVANAYDGAHDERFASDGESRSAGLQREKGDLHIDARVMDGFNIKFHGDHLSIHYHGGCRLKDTHNRNKFESEINQHLADVAKYLKKEYKKITDNTLTLTKEADSEILVQYISRIRCDVQASQMYKIGGMDGVVDAREPSSEERLDDTFKKWLKLGKGMQPSLKKRNGG